MYGEPDVVVFVDSDTPEKLASFVMGAMERPFSVGQLRTLPHQVHPYLLKSAEWKGREHAPSTRGKRLRAIIIVNLTQDYIAHDQTDPTLTIAGRIEEQHGRVLQFQGRFHNQGAPVVLLVDAPNNEVLDDIIVHTLQRDLNPIVASTRTFVIVEDHTARARPVNDEMRLRILGALEPADEEGCTVKQLLPRLRPRPKESLLRYYLKQMARPEEDVLRVESSRAGDRYVITEKGRQAVGESRQTRFE